MATKYRLELEKLKCIRKQDTVGRDEPELKVDGVTVYGPGNLGKGDSVTLNRSALFITNALVQLIEVDAGSNDDMGTVTVKGSADVGKGSRVKEFHRTHSDYELTYEVVAA
ncbi:MAG: hypothetical protein L0H41_00880 [Microlunatus sp.]|nr:hypothetical protein [Microlunatus sp.]MDN5769529.1 hypothetical protein [Microlunatus sp.]MDN5803818.1 hypothetical protein [Microlunatus sp.]